MRFGLEEEQKAALYEMNGFIGLGSKSLKICNAVPKPKTAITTGTTNTTTTSSALPNSGYSSTAATDYSQYYDPSTYWQGYNTQWQGYEQQGQHSDYTAYYQQQAAAHAQQQQQQTPQTTSHHTSSSENWTHMYEHPQEDDDLALVGKIIVCFFLHFKLSTVTVSVLFSIQNI